MAQYPGVPWNQRPDYLALTRRVDPAGVVTTYNPPRPGVSATDVTSFVFGQANITVDNWPEIMYYLDPPLEWRVFRRTRRPPQKVDANGQAMFERFPRQGQPARPLLDYLILPDTICSQEQLWWIDLWRRMDPRIRWEDILMRIEVPNRTADLDRRLQNSTNNLINRQEHALCFMLSWHSTGANSMRRNRVRTEVLHRVNAANPPLPPNSTRGITPGLINPLLGNVPANVIPQPVRGNNNHGRLIVPNQQRVIQAAAAAAAATPNQALTNMGQANLAQVNPVQANLVQANPVQTNPSQPNQIHAASTQNNQGRNNQEHGSRVPSKRRRHTSPEQTGQPQKRRPKNRKVTSKHDDMDTDFDESNSSEDIPLLAMKAPTKKGRPRKPANSTTAVRKVKDSAVKRKTKSKKVGRAKEVKQSNAHQQQDSDNEPELSEHDSNAEDKDVEDPAALLFRSEDDPGFEAAFQAQTTRQARREAHAAGLTQAHGAGQTRRPRPPRPGPAHLDPQIQQSLPNLISDSEILEDIENSGLMAPIPSSRTAKTLQMSAPPTHPANTSTPIPRQTISANTNSPFTRPNRRLETLSGYDDSLIQSIDPRVRNTRVAPTASVRITESTDGRATVTQASNAAILGLPLAPPNRPPQSYYAPAPDGSHHHYTDGSGRPTYATRPEPSSSNTRIGFTPNQRAYAQAQTIAPPMHPGQNIQGAPHNPTPAPAPDPTHLIPNDRLVRLTAEIARHDNALLVEQRRLEQSTRELWSIHTRNFRNIMTEGQPGWASEFVDREMEREGRRLDFEDDDEETF